MSNIFGLSEHCSITNFVYVRNISSSEASLLADTKSANISCAGPYLFNSLGSVSNIRFL